MSNAEIIGIDHGNFQMKTPNDVFISKLKEYPAAPGERNQLNDILIYRNRYFEVSNKPGEIRMNKTDTDDYRLLTMIALAKELRFRGLDPRTTKVRLAVGLPPGIYSEHTVKAFKEYLQKENPMIFTYSNVGYQIDIVGVDVYAQGLGTLFYTDNEVLDECPDQFILLDVGGGTSEMIGIENGRMIRQTMTSVVKGVISLSADIKNQCLMSMSKQFSDHQIFRILDGQVRSKTEREIKMIADRVLKDFVHLLKDKGVSNELYFDTMPVLLSGGGSKFLYDYFKAETESEQVYYEPDIKANAIGYEMISRAKQEKAA